MVFQRRKPISIGQRIKGWIWPESGWHRASRYIGHRLGRLPGTPYRIAAGFACGAAVSFTPFIGLHFVLAALVCLLLRGNLIASAIGTAVGNPWTFPFIWAWIYTLGGWLMGGEATAELPDGLTISYIFDRPFEVLVPMMAGSVPTAMAAWIAVFLPARALVEHYQRARRRRMRRKVERRRVRNIKAAAKAEAKARAKALAQEKAPADKVEQGGRAGAQS